MQLKISIVSAPQSAIDDPTDWSFEQLPVSVGRSTNCDVVLPDNEKHVSSRHAEFSLIDKVLTVTDISSNGVFVNGSTAALGRGNSMGLSSGDTLQMGGFVIDVELRTSIPTPHNHGDPFNQPFPDSATPASTGDHDPFDGLADLSPQPQNNRDQHIDRLEDIGIGPSAWDSDPITTDDPFADLSDNGAQTPVTPAQQPSPVSTGDDDWAGWLGELPDDPPQPQTPSPGAPPAEKPRLATDEAGYNTPGRPAAESDELNILLQAAGLDPQTFSHIDRQSLAAHIGKILNRSTQGMMLLLRSRDEIKNAMRADVTLLAPSGNNPLKFSISVEAALESLMKPSAQSGFDDAEKAIDKGLQDIKVHQLAMLEAMRSALDIALSQFDPEQLEQNARKSHPLASSLPLAKQAKLWEEFQTQYSLIKREAVDDFSDLFGRELRKAYESSVEQLEQSINGSRKNRR